MDKEVMMKKKVSWKIEKEPLAISGIFNGKKGYWIPVDPPVVVGTDVLNDPKLLAAIRIGIKEYIFKEA